MEINVEMIEFRDDLAEYFTELNLAWLTKYFEVEPIDEEMLNDPKKYIIDKGGYIFFVAVDGEIAGTFALQKMEDGIYELSKMAVDEAFRGKKLGNKIMEFCIDEAKRLQFTKLYLYSNTKLQPAVHLYFKYGFEEIPLNNSGYKRSNIKMELTINDTK